MDETALLCHLCGQEYESQNLLHYHILHTHPEEPSGYVCKACRRTFDSKWRLQKHHRETLCGGTNVCEGCGKMFVRLGTLCKHQRHSCIQTRRQTGGAVTTGAMRWEAARLNLPSNIWSAMNISTEPSTKPVPHQTNICRFTFGIFSHLSNIHHHQHQTILFNSFLYTAAKKRKKGCWSLVSWARHLYTSQTSSNTLPSKTYHNLWSIRTGARRSAVPLHTLPSHDPIIL